MKRVFLTAAVLLLGSRAFCAELLVPGEYPTIQAAVAMVGLESQLKPATL